MDYIFGRQDFAGADAPAGDLPADGPAPALTAPLSTAFSATRGDHALLMACLRAPPPPALTWSTAWASASPSGNNAVWLSTQDKAGAPDEGRLAAS